MSFRPYRPRCKRPPKMNFTPADVQVGQIWMHRDTAHPRRIVIVRLRPGYITVRNEEGGKEYEITIESLRGDRGVGYILEQEALQWPKI